MAENANAMLKRRLTYNISVIVLFAIVTICCIFFMRDELHKQAEASYELLAQNYAVQQEAQFDHYRSLMALSSELIGEMDARGASTDEIQENLSAFLEGYERVYNGLDTRSYAVINGEIVSSSRDFIYSDLKTLDWENSDWYRLANEGEGDIMVTDAYEDKLSGQTCITLTQKVPGTDDVIAFDLLFTKESVEGQAINLPKGATYILCDGAGDVLYAQSSITSNLIEDQRLAAEVLALLPAEHLSSSYTVEDNAQVFREKSVIYIQHLQNGWDLILSVPDEVIMAGTGVYYIIVGILSVLALVCICLFAFRDYGREKKRMALTEERDTMVHRSQIYRKTIDAALSAYREVCYVDLQNDLLITVVTPNGEEFRTASYDDALNRYFSYNSVDPADMARVKSSLTAANLKRELAHQDMFEVRFQVKPRGESKRESFAVTVTVIDRDETGPTRATMTIRSIENLLVKEDAQRELLTALADRARAASQAKSDFLSRMSHDIRTPMNAIVGIASLAKLHTNEPQYMDQALEKITNSSDILLSLIDNVLDMGVIESGRLVLAKQEFSIADLMKNQIDLFEVEAQRKEISLTCSLDSIEHQEVQGDADRLRQIVANLLDNAIRFTPEGGSVSVTVIEKPSVATNKQCFEFEVADTGIGMTPEFLARVFEPFARASDSRTTSGLGSGLGLPIAKNLAQLMGGDIEVSSALGFGSVFTATVYLEVQNTQASSQPEKAPSPNDIESFKEQTFNRDRVLVVDDVGLNNEVMCELLEIIGVESEVATDGQEAVDAVLAHEPGYYDLVLMDIQMPRMDGYEATRRIRSSGREDLVTLPIVAVTANAFAEDVEQAKKAGMNSHVSKPLSLKVLSETLEAWLSKPEDGDKVG